MKRLVCFFLMLSLLAMVVPAQRKRKPAVKATPTPSPTPAPAPKPMPESQEANPFVIVPRQIHPTPTPDVNKLPPKVYAFAGKIEAIYPALKTLSVEHETIPGYMEAMTMKFPVKEAKLIEGLKVGDYIDAKLHVSQNSGDWWLTDIRRRPAKR